MRPYKASLEFLVVSILHRNVAVLKTQAHRNFIKVIHI